MARGSNFIQGKFRPTNPKKYRGDVSNVVFRSSWELAFMKWCDDTPDVLAWVSEETVIPYISKVDGRKHRYFIDFCVWVRTPTGIQKKLIEIKPYAETQKPKRTPTMKDQAWAEVVRTYLVNQSKWEAAREYAASNEADFLLITERQLFPQNHSLKRYKQPKKG